MTANPTALEGLRITYTPSGSGEVDITGDVLQATPIRAAWGITGSTPLDRTSSTGRITFALDNSERNSAGLLGYYSPGNVNCRSGWATGVTIRLYLTYNNVEICRFRGRIPSNGLKIISGSNQSRRVEVTALDWINETAQPLITPQSSTNKRLYQVAQAVITAMATAPSGGVVDLSSNDVFPVVFDTTREGTTALAELSKAAQSELGYLYYLSSTDTVYAVGRYYRSGFSSASVYQYAQDNIDAETGDDLISESGALILASSALTAEINTPSGADIVNPGDAETVHGDIYNQIRYTTYPRRIDTSPVVLWSLASGSITLSPGETKTGIYGRYKNPTGGNVKVSGSSMIAPVASTDYVMVDNSAVDITASLSVSVAYGTEGALYTLTNNHATKTGYVNKLQARGYGIYIDDPLTLIINDTSSQTQNGIRALSLDLKYQTDITATSAIAVNQLGFYKAVNTRIDRMSFVANYNPALMTLAVFADINDRLLLSDRLSGILSALYYIQAVELSISAGRLVTVALTVKPSSLDSYSTWALGTPGKSELGSTTYVVYT